MAKTNFTKVEGAFDDGLRKITVAKLLDEATAASGKEAIVSAHQETSTQRQQLIALQQDLKLLSKKIPEIYTELKMPPERIEGFLARNEQLKAEEWNEVKRIIEICAKLKKRQNKDALPEENDNLVSKERRKHINKRFNINEKWLPLQ